MTHAELFKIVRPMVYDYKQYGGQVERWADIEKNYPDCSLGCKYFVPLEGELGNDWGVCANPKSERVGLLTFEHQAGYDCYVDYDE